MQHRAIRQERIARCCLKFYTAKPAGRGVSGGLCAKEDQIWGEENSIPPGDEATDEGRVLLPDHLIGGAHVSVTETVGDQRL